MPADLTTIGTLMAPSWLSDPGIGLPKGEISIPLPTTAFTNQFIDSALVEVPARIKSLAIVVTSPITSAGAQQATVRLYAARSRFGTLGTVGVPGPGLGSTQPTNPFLAAQGGTSQFPTTGPNASQAVGQSGGGATNFGPSTASIANGIYWFTATSPGNPSASPPTSLTELAQWYPVLGIEITAPATFTGGAALAFFECSPL